MFDCLPSSILMDGTQHQIQLLENTILDLYVSIGEQQREVNADVANANIHYSEGMVRALKEVTDMNENLEMEKVSLEHRNCVLMEELTVTKDASVDSLTIGLQHSRLSTMSLIFDRVKVLIVDLRYLEKKFQMYFKIFYKGRGLNFENCIFDFTSQAVECVNGIGQW